MVTRNEVPPERESTMSDFIQEALGKAKESQAEVDERNNAHVRAAKKSEENGRLGMELSREARDEQIAEAQRRERAGTDEKASDFLKNVSDATIIEIPPKSALERAVELLELKDVVSNNKGRLSWKDFREHIEYLKKSGKLRTGQSGFVVMGKDFNGSRNMAGALVVLNAEFNRITSPKESDN